MGGGSGASRTPLLLTTLHLLPPTYYDYLLQGERHFSYRHTHVRGRAILHCGHHRHGADDLASGEIVDPNPQPSPSPLTTHHSPLTTHHSPLTTQPSSSPQPQPQPQP